MSSDRLFAFAGDHLLLSLIFLGLTVALVYNEISRLLSGYKAVNPARLTTLINREDAVLVDVSPMADFEKGHIVGAKNIVMSQFTVDHKLLAKAKDSPLVIACRNGIASADAAKRLVKAGYSKVHWLDGGVSAWQQADLPLIKGKA